MNKLYILLTSVLISLSSYAQISTSKWINTPLIIDGKNTDWGDKPSYYAPGCMMLYELKNDSNYLYLIFEIMDKKSQRKFMHAGFEIAMKVKTKPKLNANINFIAQQIQKHSMQEAESLHNNNGMQQTYIVNSSYAEVNGFLKTNELINRNVNGNEQFTYNIGWNNINNMIIEIQIPISEIFMLSSTEVKYAQTPISLTCKLNALKPPSGNHMHSQRGDGSSGGRPHGTGGFSGGNKPVGNSRSGSSYRHGGQGGPSGDIQTMSNVQTFKAKFRLSNGNEL